MDVSLWATGPLSTSASPPSSTHFGAFEVSIVRLALLCLALLACNHTRVPSLAATVVRAQAESGTAGRQTRRRRQLWLRRPAQASAPTLSRATDLLAEAPLGRLRLSAKRFKRRRTWLRRSFNLAVVVIHPEARVMRSPTLMLKLARIVVLILILIFMLMLTPVLMPMLMLMPLSAPMLARATLALLRPRRWLSVPRARPLLAVRERLRGRTTHLTASKGFPPRP